MSYSLTFLLYVIDSFAPKDSEMDVCHNRTYELYTYRPGRYRSRYGEK